MNTQTESTTCACSDCECKVEEGHRVVSDGKEFCSDACATGHANGEGCCDGHCHCHG